MKESLSLIEIEGAQSRPNDILRVFNVSKRRSRHLLNIFLTVIVRRTYDAGMFCVCLWGIDISTNFTQTSRRDDFFYFTYAQNRMIHCPSAIFLAIAKV